MVPSYDNRRVYITGERIIVTMNDIGIIRHGDVNMFNINIRGLKNIPVKAKDTGKMVMHGESGHKHMIKSGQVLMLETPITVETSAGNKKVEKFLHIPETTTITHEEHLTRTIPKGDYIVLQEREMDHMAEVEKTVLD